MDESNILDLFSGDPALATSQAQALANAIRGRRAAGTLGMITGDPAMGAVGKEMTGDADKMEQTLVGAGQHLAQQRMMGQHYANEAARWDALARAQQQNADTRSREADTRQQLAALRAGEVRAIPDAWGNIITYKKFPDGSLRTVLPGATSAAGGGPPAPRKAAPPATAPASPAATGPTSPSADAGPAPGPPVAPPTGSNMDQAAFDQAAEQYRLTGKAGHYGKAQGIMERAFRQRIAQLHPDADLASTQGGYTADAASLKKQQQLLDLTKSWEATGKANLGVLRDVSKQLVDAGSPWLNAPLRTLYEKGAGDPTVTKFKAAHAAVVNEYAKILSGSMGSAGVTEGARHEAEGMLPLSSTPAQIAAAADLLETDAGNRLSALSHQVEATRQRMGAKGPAAPAAAETPPVPGAFKTKSGRWAVKNAQGRAEYVE